MVDVENIKNGNFEFQRQRYTVDYNWYEFVKLIATHPQRAIKWTDDKQRVELLDLQVRGRTPHLAKDIINTLKDKFYKNRISLLAFAGMTASNKSLDIHSDGMDVYYVQWLGEVVWRILEPKDDKDKGVGKVLRPDQVEEVWSHRLVPGDAIYVPRGMFHHIIPENARVGFSFGVEDDPNPRNYIS